MKIIETSYDQEGRFDIPNWITAKAVYALKSSFLVVYEAVTEDKNGTSSTMLLHIEYPKELLRKFKKQFNLS